MSNNSGTLVNSPIRPQSPDDVYPSAIANEIQGGYKTFQTLEGRDSLPAERRAEGEMCFVIDENALYVLKGGIDNDSWVLQNTGGGGAVGDLLPKGPFNENHDYDIGDVISYNGSSYALYVLVTPNYPNTPPDQDSDHWMYIAQKGDAGDVGQAGEQGPAGSDGTPGTPGTKIYPGTSAPGSANEGDYFLDEVYGVLYIYESGNWNFYTTLKGANGSDGTNGVDGANGQGVPTGGNTGQVLAKASNADFDTHFVDVSGSGDMLATTYDPTHVASDAFAMDNMGQGATKKYVGAADVTKLSNLSGVNTGDQTTVTGNAGTATKLQTARAIDGQSFDGSAAITVIAPGTHAATSKTTPVDADEVPIVDSAVANVLKKLTWANIKATLKTYFDSIYQASLGYTAENTANKDVDGTFAANSDTKYPSQKATKTYADTKYANTVPLNSITVPNGDVSLNTHKLTNVVDPSAAQDAATKAYVDSVAQGLSVKGSVLLATAAPLPANTYVAGVITITATGTLTVDGSVVALNDRILVKDEVSGLKNGIYVVTTAGAIGVAAVLTRSADMNTSAEFAGGFVFSETGTVNTAAGFVCTNSTPPTVGTTPITFTQFSGAGEILAGTGISKSGNTISIDTAVTVDKTTAQTLTNKTLTSPAISTPTGLVKGDVGLANVDNTSDATKNAATVTLTNKRVTKRVTAITSNATPTINTDNCDAVDITALATAITSMTTNLTGTPANKDMLIFEIKDDGTARAITWGASFVAGGVALPTTTVISKILLVGFQYSTANGLNKWRCIASAQEA